MPVFNIHHITKYEYDRPVKESVNEIRIYPFAGNDQEVLYHELNVTGQPEIMTITDYWGNRAGMFNLIQSHRELVIESKLVVRTLAKDDKDATAGGSFSELREAAATDLFLLELARAEEADLKDQIAAITQEVYRPDAPVAEVVQQTCHYIYSQFKYIKGITSIETTVAEILAHRSGVCQDFAHVMLEVLRSLRIPTRYVSGYICPNKDGMRGEGATHAWVEAWIPGLGWAGIDPTNNVWVTNRHVKLAVGRNFNDCSPVKGTFKGPARQSLSVYVSIGYEDGHKFEDMTNVKMEKQEGVPDPIPELLETFAGQQQQQQQQ